MLILLATDAAGEGINLQRAHLMVNYDLPWNPNRLEQRFGRIHRIGQTEVCHLWNLIADETREGDVYRRLLEKLEQARESLGGQVFDVLGKLQFAGRPLRDLLLEAIRYGEQPEVRARLTTVLDNALDRERLQNLLEDAALAPDAMDATRVQRVREELERAAARRLQPHYIESFFRAAFARLGGSLRQREPRRYEITHVPGAIRSRDRLIGAAEPVVARYERIAFEKDLLAPPGKPPAAFLCPGHPLLDAVLDLTLERHRDLLKRGTVLVDERDPGTAPRVLFYLEHAIQDASRTRNGDRRRRIEAPALRGAGRGQPAASPALRAIPRLPPLTAEEPDITGDSGAPRVRLDHWRPGEHGSGARGNPRRAGASAGDPLGPAQADCQDRGRGQGSSDQGDRLLGPPHLPTPRPGTGRPPRRQAQLRRGAPPRRCAPGAAPAATTTTPARSSACAVTSGSARRVLVVPQGLLAAIRGERRPRRTKSAIPRSPPPGRVPSSWKPNAALGFEPTDRETEHLGYDIESRVPGTGKLRFIEVKGRVHDADTITVHPQRGPLLAQQAR